MGAVSEFADLAAKRRGHADFVVVYVAEAHPSDGWVYPSVEHKIKQPLKIRERLDAARILRSKLDDLTKDAIPMFIDGMSNATARMFGAVPERLAIVLNGKLAWLGGEGPMNYSVEKCAKALDAFFEE